MDEVETRLAGDVAQPEAARIGGGRDAEEKGEDDAGGNGRAEGRGAPYRVRAR